MRILHVEKFLPATGGVGSYLRRLSELQRSRGHEVLQFGCVTEPSSEFPFFEDFTTTRDPRALLRMIHNQQGADKLRSFLRKHPVDVAHLHNIYHHLSPSILPVLMDCGVGVVMTLHDYRLFCPTKHFLRPDGPCTRCVGNKFYHAASLPCAGVGGAALAVESFVQRLGRRYFRGVGFFLCPTNYMRQLALKAGVPRSKVVVHRNVIEELEIPAGQVRDQREVLFFGRLSPEKGPHLMLELAERLDDARIVIAGDGPLASELKQQVSERNVSNVELVGRVDHRQIGRYVARATAVVLPSVWFENSPQTMLEAMLAGRCVIVPDHPPLTEWVRDGVTGRVFSPGDVESLTEVVEEVLDDPASRSRMERAGRVLVEERHDAEVLMDRLDGLYEEAIPLCALQW